MPSLSTSSYRQVRPVEVPDPRPPLPVVPRPRRGRRPPDDGLGDAEVGVFAASAEVSVVGPRVGRGRGDHAAEQPGRLGLARHGALRERVLDVHPADELGEARELLGRDADVFRDGPGAKLPLRGSEEGQGGALVGGEGDDEDEEDAEGTTSVPAPAEGGGGSGPGARRSGLRPVPAGGSFSVEKAWRVEREREREREKERRGRVFFVLAGAVGRKNELIQSHSNISYPCPHLCARSAPRGRHAVASRRHKGRIQRRRGAAPARRSSDHRRR